MANSIIELSKSANRVEVEVIPFVIPDIVLTLIPSALRDQLEKLTAISVTVKFFESGGILPIHIHSQTTKAIVASGTTTI